MGNETEDMNQHFVNGYTVDDFEQKIEKQQASKKKKMYIHMVLLMLSSTANIVVQTYQNEYFVSDPNNPDGKKIPFSHPYFQTLIYQIAELLAFIQYFVQVHLMGETLEEDEMPENDDRRFSHLRQTAIAKYSLKHSIAGRKRTLVGSFLAEPGLGRSSFISSFMGQERPHNEIPQAKKPLPPIMIIIPTIFDIGETLCSNVALTLIAASVT